MKTSEQANKPKYSALVGHNFQGWISSLLSNWRAQFTNTEVKIDTAGCGYLVSVRVADNNSISNLQIKSKSTCTRWQQETEIGRIGYVEGFKNFRSVIRLRRANESDEMDSNIVQ